MPGPKLAVLGASGFVGSTLCERLYGTREFEFMPYVHTFGNTSRLARFPLPLTPLDVMSSDQLASALAGYDVVVDLTRNLPPLMATMTRNLVTAARKAGVKKIIHLSSIAIYGKRPGPETSSEVAVPVSDDAYGAAKLRQDEILLELHRGGIPVVLICPANIYGPYAPFIIRAVQYLREGQILLVDGGKTPTNNVHVENVVEAILAAVRTEAGVGERYFVNDPEPTTWAEFYADLQRIIGLEGALPQVPSAPVREIADRPGPQPPRFRDNFTALLSGEFRKALSHLPAFAALNGAAYDRFSQCSPEFQARVRSVIARPTHVAKGQAPGPDLGNRYVTEQLRSVYHSPDKLAKQLGWSPYLTYPQAMKTVEEWLRFTNRA